MGSTNQLVIDLKDWASISSAVASRNGQLPYSHQPELLAGLALILSLLVHPELARSLPQTLVRLS
jgi:hypothetical protein